MIIFDDVVFRYNQGDFIFHMPSLEISQGEHCAVIGPSGSGKTTLLNLISGILLPNSGEIHVGDTKLNELSESDLRAYRIQEIGFVFQDFALIEYLNVLDNIIHPYRISKALSLDQDVVKRAEQLAFQMGIFNKLKRYPKELSHGERQRVAICRALITQPSLILADEATGNLDPDNKTKILDLLFRASEEHKATLISVTHDHNLLGRFERIIDFEKHKKKLKQGKVA